MTMNDRDIKTPSQVFRIVKGAGDDPSIRLDVHGDWYVSSKLHIGGDGMIGTVGGLHAPDPETAVAHFWEAVCDVPPGRWLTVDPMSETRRRIRWNGFMWEDVP